MPEVAEVPEDTAVAEVAEDTAVGWIGLGDQGGPMAEMVLGAGFGLAVWARDPDKAKWLRDGGAVLVADPAELGATCDVVGICVPDDRTVEEVLVDRQVLASMRSGGCVLIHSTVAPETCRRLAHLGSERGVAVLDAPVSGGGAAARARKLAVMVGGPVESFERVRPVLRTFGDPIHHVGAAGTAAALKLVNNGLFVANLWMAWNALGLAEQLGVDRETAASVLKVSSGRSTGLEVVDHLVGTDWGGHAWKLLSKDVDLLERTEAGGPVAEAARAAIGRLSPKLS